MSEKQSKRKRRESARPSLIPLGDFIEKTISRKGIEEVSVEVVHHVYVVVGEDFDFAEENFIYEDAEKMEEALEERGPQVEIHFLVAGSPEGDEE